MTITYPDSFHRAPGFRSAILTDHLAAYTNDLPAINEPSKQAVDARLDPQQAILAGDIEEVCPTTLDQHETADGGSGGEELTDDAPIGGEGVGGPRDAGRKSRMTDMKTKSIMPDSRVRMKPERIMAKKMLARR